MTSWHTERMLIAKWLVAIVLLWIVAAMLILTPGCAHKCSPGQIFSTRPEYC